MREILVTKMIHEASTVITLFESRSIQRFKFPISITDAKMHRQQLRDDETTLHIDVLTRYIFM